MTISENIFSIRARAGKATLIAVSKTQGIESIRQALTAGQRVFGENRVQEAKSKFPALRRDYPDLELHLIGPLQTNKVHDALEVFDVIQTLDRPRLADALAASLKKSGRTPRLYIEVNIGSEKQKAGVTPDQLGPFLEYCCNACRLTISGLMCIPPQKCDPRPFFMQMSVLAERHALAHLSMGMSADFEQAVACGATEIRVGTALFGTRP